MKRLPIPILLILSLVGCSKQPPPQMQSRSQQDSATISITDWTQRTELFLEYPALVSGAVVRFAVHLTDLRDFTPIASGKVRVELVDSGGRTEVFEANGSSRPGIFGVNVRPRSPGTYRMAVILAGSNLADRHDLGEVKVFASEKEISIQEEKPKEETITFLKEQQWSLDFATERAAERELRESLTVTGEVRPRSGGEVNVTAPIGGRITADSRLPIAGTLVSRGQAVAAITPLPPAPGDRASLELAISEAIIALDLAKRDRQRTERLLTAGAIPARRVEDARAAEATAGARLQTAQQKLRGYEASRQAEASGSEGTFTLRAPISGIVVELKTSGGSNVSPGDPLIRIVAIDPVYLVGSVPETEVPRIRRLTGAEVEIPGDSRPVQVSRLISKSNFIDPQSRTLGVIYEVQNPARALAIGQSVSLRLFLSGRERAISVPESAIVDDAGLPVVFVQLEGEAFARRTVTLGVRESGYVQVLEGVRLGEWIVTRGAYLIRLAALSSQIPAHGHVH
ncbi:MAG: efflux RND transporter periplasmic adaptor subunit [Acidobacteria bacterium]|nr:efflux RND transporter periplasmic adaptor subunit [Acidobacteriota bacterium]